MAHQPSIVSFDCYGTLVDWRGGMRAALESLQREEGVMLPVADVITRYLAREVEVEKTWRPYREVLEVALGLALDDLGVRVSPRARKVFAATIGTWPPFPETRSALASLREDGTRIAILSNVDDDMIERSVAAIGVPFDWVVTALAVHSYKPGPAHWDRLIELCGAGKSEILHVGASLHHDIEPAAKLGFRTVWIDRLSEPPGSVRADHRLPDLRELPELVRRGVG
jgi:2-haloacid dehalogenase